MSVLIKGMEMPKNCMECPLLYEAECQILGCDTFTYIDECHPNCPLVEIPTPHGRLIDADRVVNNLSLLAEFEPQPHQSHILGCVNTIRSSPTAIEAEE